jgi:thioredoxin 1
MFTINKDISIVNFYVSWCFYSKIQKLILNKFQMQKQEKVRVYNINSDRNKSLVEKFHVNTFPSILIFKNGDVIEHLKGLQDNETLKKAVNKAILNYGHCKN